MSSKDMMDDIKEVDLNEAHWKDDIHWKIEHEKMLIEWADKAMCYRWLHSKSNQRYGVLNKWFTIPVIIMSTLTGTANFAQDKFPENTRVYAQMGIGAINIFAGILTTIAQFLKISELNEAHRVSSISWDKFYRNIKVELSKSREERIHVNQMLKICKEEFDRLMEISPDINENIIKQFKNTFASNKETNLKLIKNKKYNLFSNISKPEICDELETTAKILYKLDDDDGGSVKENRLLNLAEKNKKQNDKFEKEVNDFIEEYKSVHQREPNYNEIIRNLEDKISIEVLTKILNRMLTLKIIEKV
jgi:hypothetical protein